jgi:hypothetical protein
LANPSEEKAEGLVAFANRLPVARGRQGWRPSVGGLVSALRPALESRDSAWVGWDGGADDIPHRVEGLDVELLPIALSRREVEDFYHGFANRTLWPLLHGLTRLCRRGLGDVGSEPALAELLGTRQVEAENIAAILGRTIILTPVDLRLALEPWCGAEHGAHTAPGARVRVAASDIGAGDAARGPPSPRWRSPACR